VVIVEGVAGGSGVCGSGVGGRGGAAAVVTVSVVVGHGSFCLHFLGIRLFWHMPLVWIDVGIFGI